jgi:hypothetical protein
VKRQTKKVLVFLFLLGVFFFSGGFEYLTWMNEPVIANGKNSPIGGWMIVYIFVVSAYLAVWGDKTVGTIHPVSFRSAYILVGSLIMGFILLFMWSAREASHHHLTRKPPPVNVDD